LYSYSGKIWKKGVDKNTPVEFATLGAALSHGRCIKVGLKGNALLMLDSSYTKLTVIKIDDNGNKLSQVTNPSIPSYYGFKCFGENQDLVATIGYNDKILRIYKLNENTLKLTEICKKTTNLVRLGWTVAICPRNRFLAVSDFRGRDIETIEIYEFTGTQLNLKTSINIKKYSYLQEMHFMDYFDDQLLLSCATYTNGYIVSLVYNTKTNTLTEPTNLQNNNPGGTFFNLTKYNNKCLKWVTKEGKMVTAQYN